MDEFVEKANKLHDPELAKKEGDHVYQFWDDGEITSTKCGSLLGQRTLHTIQLPVTEAPCCKLAGVYNRHTYVYVTYDQAIDLQNQLRSLKN